MHGTWSHTPPTGLRGNRFNVIHAQAAFEKRWVGRGMGGGENPSLTRVSFLEKNPANIDTLEYGAGHFVCFHFEGIPVDASQNPYNLCYPTLKKVSIETKVLNDKKKGVERVELLSGHWTCFVAAGRLQNKRRDREVLQTLLSDYIQIGGREDGDMNTGAGLST